MTEPMSYEDVIDALDRHAADHNSDDNAAISTSIVLASGLMAKNRCGDVFKTLITQLHRYDGSGEFLLDCIIAQVVLGMSFENRMANFEGEDPIYDVTAPQPDGSILRGAYNVMLERWTRSFDAANRLFDRLVPDDRVDVVWAAILDYALRHVVRRDQMALLVSAFVVLEWDRARQKDVAA